MRTRIATSYSNIFMGYLEQQLLSSRKHKPWVWWSYINDIFIIWTIWTSGKENLQYFIEDINKFHPTIETTRDWSYYVATLLVIKIHLKTIQSTQTSMLDQQHPPILTPEQLPPCSLQTSHLFWPSKVFEETAQKRKPSNKAYIPYTCFLRKNVQGGQTNVSRNRVGGGVELKDIK